MKALLAVIVLELLLVGCGPGPAKKPLLEDFESLKALAEKGDAKAQYNLGTMYRSGEGVEQDDKEALKWILKAIEQGQAEAQYNLGTMYELGDGVGQDYVTAYTWYNIAAANGYEEAKEDKDAIAKKMTAEDISKAQALSKEMIAKNPKLIKK